MLAQEAIDSTCAGASGSLQSATTSISNWPTKAMFDKILSLLFHLWSSSPENHVNLGTNLFRYGLDTNVYSVMPFVIVHITHFISALVTTLWMNT